MKELMMYLDFYSLAVFMLPDLLFIMIGANKKHLEHKKSYCFWTILYSLYCYLAIVQIAGIGSLWDWIDRGHLDTTINLHPFASQGVLTYILNIIMFIPLGFLLPLIFRDYRKLWKTAVTGLMMSCIIEFFQLFSLRATDIDDLSMNTIGTFVGYFLYWVCDKWFSRRKTGGNGITKYDGILLIVMGTISTFLLYNWRWLY